MTSMTRSIDAHFLFRVSYCSISPLLLRVEMSFYSYPIIRDCEISIRRVVSIPAATRGFALDDVLPMHGRSKGQDMTKPYGKCLSATDLFVVRDPVNLKLV